VRTWRGCWAGACSVSTSPRCSPRCTRLTPLSGRLLWGNAASALLGAARVLDDAPLGPARGGGRAAAEPRAAARHPADTTRGSAPPAQLLPVLPGARRRPLRRLRPDSGPRPGGSPEPGHRHLGGPARSPRRVSPAWRAPTQRRLPAGPVRVVSPVRGWMSWSSGKDSAFALHTVRTGGRVEITGLLTTLTAAADRLAVHGVRRACCRLKPMRSVCRCTSWSCPGPAPMTSTKIG